MTEVKFLNSTDKYLEVAVKGELDTDAVPDFAKNFEPVVKQAAKDIMLDFTGLEYISSSGLRVLLVLAQQSQASGGTLSIKGMTPDLKQIFSLIAFDEFFKII